MKIVLILALVAAFVAVRILIYWKNANRPVCTFRSYAEDPSLVAGLHQAERLLLHIRACPGCKKVLQRTLKRPMHYSEDMYPVWAHLSISDAKRIQTGGTATQREKLRLHLEFCDKCGPLAATKK